MVGLIINKIAKFPIICKYESFQCFNDIFIVELNYDFLLVFILSVTGLSGIGCMLTDIPALQISFFLSLLCCGVAANVVSSATVELYPTTLR